MSPRCLDVSAVYFQIPYMSSDERNDAGRKSDLDARSTVPPSGMHLRGSCAHKGGFRRSVDEDQTGRLPPPVISKDLQAGLP